MNTNKKVETISQENIEILEPQNNFVDIEDFQGEVIDVDEFTEKGEVHKKSFFEKLTEKIKNFFHKLLVKILEWL